MLRRNPVRFLRKIFDGVADVRVVQIGSNDGLTHDPIHDLILKNPSWKGLFVEPVPFLFAKLRENYGNDPRFEFEDLAIAKEAGTLPFYYVSSEAAVKIPDLPVWHDQLGSFSPSHIVNHLGEMIVPYITKVEIRTDTFAAVLARHAVQRIDLLHIDAEGADWLILQQLDLTKFRPKVILIEKKHLDEKSQSELRAFLRDYKIVDLDADYLCRLK
jgi:FkbM family methyltransferase